MKLLKISSFIFMLLGSGQLQCLPSELESLKDPANRRALLEHIRRATNTLRSTDATRLTREFQGQAAQIADGCQQLQGWQGQVARVATGASSQEFGQFTAQCESFQRLWNQFHQYGTRQA